MYGTQGVLIHFVALRCHCGTVKDAVTPAQIATNHRELTAPASSPSRTVSLEIRERPSEGTGVRQATSRNLLSPGEQRRLLAGATLLTYRRGGAALFCEGQDASFIYFISEGIIRTSRYAENGGRQILTFRVPGDLLGLSENGQYDYSAETVGAAKVYRITWRCMQQIMLVEPDLQLHLLLKIADDCRHAEQHIVTLGQQNTCQRLISFILDLWQLPDFFDERRSLMRLPVSRNDLADYIGTTTTSAERSFLKLESEHLIRRITPRTIEIIDIVGLQRLQCEQRRSHR